MRRKPYQIVEENISVACDLVQIHSLRLQERSTVFQFFKSGFQQHEYLERGEVLAENCKRIIEGMEQEDRRRVNPRGVYGCTKEKRREEGIERELTVATLEEGKGQDGIQHPRNKTQFQNLIHIQLSSQSGLPENEDHQSQHKQKLNRKEAYIHSNEAFPVTQINLQNFFYYVPSIFPNSSPQGETAK